MATNMKNIEYFRRGSPLPATSNTNSSYAFDYFRRNGPLPFATDPGNFTYTASGNIVFGGASSYKETITFLPTGNAVFGGTSNASSDAIITYTASGNVVFGNAALVVETTYYSAVNGAVFGNSASSKQNIDYLPTGNVVFGESASYKETIDFLPSGNGVFSNSASSKQNIDYLPIGNVVFGNSASSKQNIDYLPTGNVVFGGTVDLTGNFTYTASGNVVFGGTASYKQNIDFLPTGNVVFGGTASYKEIIDFLPIGNVMFGGSADASSDTGIFTYTASGNSVLGNTVTSNQTSYYESSGSVVFGNSAIYLIGGKGVFSGTAVVVANYIANTPAGGMSLDGSSVGTRTFKYETSGGLNLNSSNVYAVFYQISNYFDTRLQAYLKQQATCKTFIISKEAVNGILDDTQTKQLLNNADNWTVDCSNLETGDISLNVIKNNHNTKIVYNINRPTYENPEPPGPPAPIQINTNNVQGKIEISYPTDTTSVPAEAPTPTPNVGPTPPIVYTQIIKTKLPPATISQASLLCLLPTNHFLRKLSTNDWSVVSFNKINATVRITKNGSRLISVNII